MTIDTLGGLACRYTAQTMDAGAIHWIVQNERSDRPLLKRRQRSDRAENCLPLAAMPSKPAAPELPCCHHFQSWDHGTRSEPWPQLQFRVKEVCWLCAIKLSVQSSNTLYGKIGDAVPCAGQSAANTSLHSCCIELQHSPTPTSRSGRNSPGPPSLCTVSGEPHR